jgi:hypothetical protein
VENARDRFGVNLGFFGANAVYWQIRLEADSAGTPDRTIVGYKEHAAEDPLSGTDDDYRVTTQWRLPPVNRPEEALVGAGYEEYDIDGDIVIADPASWVVSGTGLAQGDHLKGLLGYEVNGLGPASPPGTAVIAHSPWSAPGGSGVSDMTVYTAPSGATVFATGSIQWSWGLDDYAAPGGSSRVSPAAQQITRNVLTRLGAAPAPATGPPTDLTDDFSAGSRDPERWTPGAFNDGEETFDPTIPLLQTKGHLEIRPRVGAAGHHFAGYVSTQPRDLTGLGVEVRVLEATSPDSSADTTLAVGSDENNWWRMTVEGATLYLQQNLAGVRSTQSLPYSPDDHRYWRVRHRVENDWILWETSPDGETWTSLRIEPRPLPVDGLRVELSAGTWQSEGAPGRAIFDDVRIR